MVVRQYLFACRRLCLAVFLGLALASPTHAILIDVGDVVTLNFNFVTQVPPPPYTSVFVLGVWGGVSADAIADLALFGGLNGTGPVFERQTGMPISAFVFQDTTNADILDGAFSVVIAGLAGTFDFVAASAAAEVNGLVARVEPAVILQHAPEPPTLALAMVALLVGAGYGLSRRHRAKSRSFRSTPSLA